VVGGMSETGKQLETRRRASFGTNVVAAVDGYLPRTKQPHGREWLKEAAKSGEG
jgi:hypothetical protein